MSKICMNWLSFDYKYLINFQIIYIECQFHQKFICVYIYMIKICTVIFCCKLFIILCISKNLVKIIDKSWIVIVLCFHSICIVGIVYLCAGACVCVCVTLSEHLWLSYGVYLWTVILYILNWKMLNKICQILYVYVWLNTEWLSVCFIPLQLDNLVLYIYM